MQIKVSDYIAKRLKEVYGTEQIFMVSGGGAMHLNNSFGKQLKYICNHHEQACAMGAEGFARVKQGLAVVNVTTGPGGLNCLNGVFGQWTDSVPVLYISGQVKTSTTISSCKKLKLRQLGDQEVDIISIVTPITKYAKMITEPKEIKYHLDKAIFEATTGRKAPVWLDIPMNVQCAIVEENELIDFIPPKELSKDYSKEIEDILQKLETSKRPVIVAGHGIRLSEQKEAFLELVEKLKIPILTTFNGIDVINDNNPYYMGRIGTIGQRAGNFILQNSDLILSLGTRNNIRQISYNWENYGKKAYKIVIDIDKAELEKPTARVDMGICANLKDFLPQLANKTCEAQPKLKWNEWCKARKNKYSFENTKEYQIIDENINPYYFTRKLTERLGKGDILVSANATPSICIFQTGKVNGERIIMNSGDASMGYALPTSIGARVQTMGKGNVVCFEGDGSIMMNLQELQTIKHNGLNIKIFVLKNNGYVSIQQTQKNFFAGEMTGSGASSGVSTPDFTEIGKGFGIKSVKIEKSSEIEERLDDIFNRDESIICEVVIKKEYSFSPKLSSRKLEDGTMISSTLEDMYPFLDREEFNKNMIYEEEI